MEMWEDNIIKTKLEGMDTLPKGYTPNLESKWSMLEAGLDGNRKRGGFVWKPYAAAAMLLMLGGVGLLVMRPKIKTAADIPLQHAPAVVVPKQQETQQQIAVAPEIKNKRVKAHKIALPKIDSATFPLQDDKSPETILPTDDPIPQEQLVVTTKVKKPRFVEVDFNDAPITAQKPSENVIAAQQFKFRLGTNSVSSGNQTNTGGSLRIRQSF